MHTSSSGCGLMLSSSWRTSLVLPQIGSPVTEKRHGFHVATIFLLRIRSLSNSAVTGLGSSNENQVQKQVSYLHWKYGYHKLKWKLTQQITNQFCLADKTCMCKSQFMALTTKVVHKCNHILALSDVSKIEYVNKNKRLYVKLIQIGYVEIYSNPITCNQTWNAVSSHNATILWAICVTVMQ